MLQQVKTDKLYLDNADINDNVYIDKHSTYLLVDRDPAKVRLFDINSYNTYEGTPAQFDELTRQGKFIHCQYMLLISYIPYEEIKHTVHVAAANDLDKLYNKLAKFVQSHHKRIILFDACSIEDVRSGQVLLIKNNADDVKAAIADYHHKKTFTPTEMELSKLKTGDFQSSIEVGKQLQFKIKR